MRKKHPQDRGPQCGSCAFFRREDGTDFGECYALPPRTEIDEEDTPYNVRPIVAVDDLGCVHFRGGQ
jgi:hypothetical protein